MKNYWLINDFWYKASKSKLLSLYVSGHQLMETEQSFKSKQTNKKRNDILP